LQRKVERDAKRAAKQAAEESLKGVVGAILSGKTRQSERKRGDGGDG